MRQNLTRMELASFCEELALLLHAGVDCADALTLLAEEAQQESCRTLLWKLADRADSGAPLWKAMEAEGGFPGYATGLVQVGEVTGRLEEALQALAGYYWAREREDERIRGALLYPSVLLMVMLAVIVLLLARVLPIFNEVYGALGGELRGVAGMLLALGRGLNAAMPVLCGLLGAAVAFLGAFSVSVKFRSGILAWWQRRFGDRGVLRKMNDARFAQALSMGLAGGLGAEEALELSGILLQDVPEAAQRCRHCEQLLQQGRDLTTALRISELLPAASCRLLALGFRSGGGDTAMAETARRLTEEAEQALERQVSKIEPTLVVVTSVLVGAILLSVMLPLMNIMSTIG